MILNLIKGGIVPQVFTGQVQVQRIHCSLLHCQDLELDKQAKQNVMFPYFVFFIFFSLKSVCYQYQ